MSQSEHDIMAAIEGATRRLRYYRVARRLYGILMETGDQAMEVLPPLPGALQPAKETVKPEEVATLDHDLTILKPAPPAPAKTAPQVPQKVQIRGMSDVTSQIRKRLESVRSNMTGLTDDLASLDKTVTDMRGHVNASHEDIHSDATMLGNSAGSGGKSSQELADRLAGDSE